MGYAQSGLLRGPSKVSVGDTPHKQAIKVYLSKSVCRIDTAAISSVLCTPTGLLQHCADARVKTAQSRRKSPPPCSELKSLPSGKRSSSNAFLDDKKSPTWQKRRREALVTSSLTLHDLNLAEVECRGQPWYVKKREQAMIGECKCVVLADVRNCCHIWTRITAFIK